MSAALFLSSLFYIIHIFHVFFKKKGGVYEFCCCFVVKNVIDVVVVVKKSYISYNENRFLLFGLNDTYEKIWENCYLL